jgi:hypothetical protein
MKNSGHRPTRKFPRGITAIGIFLLFGAVMACLAGISLTWGVTAFDRMWTLNAWFPAHVASCLEALILPN